MNQLIQISTRQQILPRNLLNFSKQNQRFSSTTYNIKKDLLSQSVRVNKISSKKFLRKYKQKENSIPVRFKQGENYKPKAIGDASKIASNLKDLLYQINPKQKNNINYYNTQYLPTYSGKSPEDQNSSYSVKKSRQHNQKKSLQLKTKNTTSIKSFARYVSEFKSITRISKNNISYYISDIKKQFQQFSGQSEDLTIKLAHFLHFLTIFRMFQTISIPKKPYKLMTINSSIRPTTLTVIFDMDQTLVHCSLCQQNQYENTITLIKQKQRRQFSINSLLKFHKHAPISTDNKDSQANNCHIQDQFTVLNSNLQPKLQDFTSDLTDFATESRTHFRVQIRPQAKEVLSRLKRSGKFSLGLFTSSRQQYADKVIQLIDPQNQLFDFRFYRNHCFIYRNRKQDMSRQMGDKFFIKDLRILQNRPLQRTVLIDNSPSSMLFQPQNGIPIFSYYGQDDSNNPDLQLPKLQAFLEKIQAQLCAQQNQDIRVILKKYFQFSHLSKQSNIKDQVLKHY